jgi:hypothetical protein
VVKSFRVNSPRVMHETIDEEVMLIDLATGNYYCLRHAGVDIWHAIERGADEGGIGDALELRYDGRREQMVSAVHQLLEELTGEGLIVSADGDGQAESPVITPTPDGDGTRAPFRGPVLEKHDDMQDLILLDPVHEVDERGWPNVGEAESGRT